MYRPVAIPKTFSRGSQNRVSLRDAAIRDRRLTMPVSTLHHLR